MGRKTAKALRIKNTRRVRRWLERLDRDGMAWGGPGLVRLSKKAAKR